MNTEHWLRIAALVVAFGLCASLFFAAPSALSVFQADRLRGDVNGDGTVTTEDARLILMIAYGKTSYDRVTYDAADVNTDGKVDTKDADLVLKALSQGEKTNTYAQKDVRAVWISTVSGDFPSRTGLGADELKAEIRTVVENCAAAGINTLFVQVRSHSDAVYRSEIFPSSRYITGKEGKELPVDVLRVFCDEAHALGLRVHAWINPYRISSSSHDLSSLSPDNPAVLHPEWTVRHFDENGKPAGVYYDPGLPEVRELVVDGVREILDYYDVDGIHFDDYFYPYTNAAGFEDDASFARYGNGTERGDWRRRNANLLVIRTCAAVRQADPSLTFGISPFGIWAKQSEKMPDGTAGLGSVLESYSDIYADTLAWMRAGNVDYICPQLYWATDHPSAPFAVLADWWREKCAEYGVGLVLGLGAYRDYGASEMFSQLLYVTEHDDVAGFSLFSYASVIGGQSHALEALHTLFGDATEVSYTGKGVATPLDGTVLRVDSSRCDFMKKPGNSSSYGPTDYALGVDGMTVSGEKAGKYYRLPNGYYVNEADVTPVAETVYETCFGTPEWFLTREYTYFFLPCDSPMTCAVRLEKDRVTVLLDGLAYGLLTVPDPPGENPLFAAASVSRTDTGATLTFRLRQKDRIFGYRAFFADGRLVIRFKNPVSVAAGKQPLHGITVSIDPGHSNTTGCVGYYKNVLYEEHDLNYDLSLRVREKLEDLGARVVFTHENERKKKLDVLIAEMREAEPDINVSIHFNWVESKNARGTSVWWCYENSALLAECLNAASCKRTGLDVKGPKCGYYKVSRFCEFPSVLFETLYVSNPDEFAWYMGSEAHKNTVAQGIADGILAFFEAQSE